MYHWIVNMPLKTIVDCFIDDVIGPQNRSRLWTPIALSIFKLEHRSKAQNVTNTHGYQSRFSIFLYERKINMFHDNWITYKDVIFKLSAHMYHWIVNIRLQAILECFVDDVIRSQNKSKLWNTIALSKFELEKRSTDHNVANWTGYQKFKF